MLTERCLSEHFTLIYLRLLVPVRLIPLIIISFLLFTGIPYIFNSSQGFITFATFPGMAIYETHCNIVIRC